MRLCKLILAGVLTVSFLSAQYPYGYPRMRRAPAKTTGIPGGNQSLAGTLHGTLKQLTNKEIIIENEDKQDVVIRRTRKTKFTRDGKDVKSSDLALSTTVSVDVVEDVDLKPLALLVATESSKPSTLGARQN